MHYIRVLGLDSTLVWLQAISGQHCEPGEIHRTNKFSTGCLLAYERRLSGVGRGSCSSNCVIQEAIGNSRERVLQEETLCTPCQTSAPKKTAVAEVFSRSLKIVEPDSSCVDCAVHISHKERMCTVHDSRLGTHYSKLDRTKKKMQNANIDKNVTRDSLPGVSEAKQLIIRQETSD
ncbi:hypothetical protein C8R43DRAFT_962337 [Mycena crocata]|nr:hypothetical protein C8R43DRAFT_962337 [Mycena crocata]